MEDAIGLYHLNKDPEVMAYAGDRPFLSIEEAQSFINNYADYKNHGMGRWSVILKENNNFCGWCGLKWNIELKEADIGFRLLQDYWNMGIATEASMACLKFGFEQLKLSSIIGRCRVKNIASYKVLEKLNMRKIKTIDYLGGNSYLYRITLSEYQALTAT